MQLVAQAELELKCQQNEAPMFATIKATSEFESTHSTLVTVKGTKKGSIKQRNNPKRRRRKPHKRRKGHPHI